MNEVVDGDSELQRVKKALRDERRLREQMREELDSMKAVAAEERMATLKKMLLQGGGGDAKQKARKRRRMRETWCPGRRGGGR